MSRTRRGTSARPGRARARARRSRRSPPRPRSPASAPVGASKVTITTATLNGKVNPHGGGDDLLLPVRHHDGLRLAHARRRAPAPAPRPSAPPRRSPGSGPNTKYHYRLVARNGVGHHGRRRSHLHHAQAAARARAGRHAQPGRLRRSLDARRHAVGHRQRRAPDPPAAEAVPVHAARSRTSATSSSRTPRAPSRSRLLSVPLTTQYRVLVTDKTSVVSPVLTVSVSVVVGTRTTQHARPPRRPRALLRHDQAERGQRPGRDPEAQRQEALGDDLGDDHPQRRHLLARRSASGAAAATASTPAPAAAPSRPAPGARSASTRRSADGGPRRATDLGAPRAGSA